MPFAERARSVSSLSESIIFKMQLCSEPCLLTDSPVFANHLPGHVLHSRRGPCIDRGVYTIIGVQRLQLGPLP
jgi:hypothetical protein